jgi:hypothetical protein
VQAHAAGRTPTAVEQVDLTRDEPKNAGQAAAPAAAGPAKDARLEPGHFFTTSTKNTGAVRHESRSYLIEHDSKLQCSFNIT